jgi:hypothetical protein
MAPDRSMAPPPHPPARRASALPGVRQLDLEVAAEDEAGGLAGGAQDHRLLLVRDVRVDERAG